MSETDTEEASPRLTPRQQAFVDAYTGNGTEAARLAGYEGDDPTLGVTACRLLKLAKIIDALAKRDAPARNARIATRQERQEYWTQVMHSEVEHQKERLRASELLAKSEGDFITRLEHSGPGGGPIKLTDHEAAAKLAAILNAARSRKDPEQPQ